MLTGLLGIEMGAILPGSVLQLIVATLFCIIYLVVQVHARPFKTESTMFVAVSASAALTVFFVLLSFYKVRAHRAARLAAQSPSCSRCMHASCTSAQQQAPPRARAPPHLLTHQFAELLELEIISERMSPHQLDIYQPDNEILIVLMIMTVFVVIVAAILISISNAANAAWDIESVQKGRLLRRVRDHMPARATPLADPDKAYYLFLSHVWSTGQDLMRIVKQRLCEMVTDFKDKIFLDVDGARRARLGVRQCDRVHERA